MFRQRCDVGIHDFEPRYNRKLPIDLKLTSAPIGAIELLKDEIYIRDICTRCGKTIELPEKSG